MYDHVSLTFRNLYAPSPSSSTLTGRMFNKMYAIAMRLLATLGSRSTKDSPSECSGLPYGVMPPQLTTVLAKCQAKYPDKPLSPYLLEGWVEKDGKGYQQRVRVPLWLRFPEADGYDPTYEEMRDLERQFEND